MKVLLDARMARHGGIGRSIRGLVRGLVGSGDPPALRLLVPGGAQRADPWHAALPVETVPFDAPLYGIREQVLGSWLARKRLPGEIWHSPHYNAPFALPRRSVVTVHDLIHFEQPDAFPRRRRWAAAAVLRRAVGRAGRIVTVSEATRQALVSRFPACEARTAVVHLGVDPAFRPLGGAAAEEFRAGRGVGRFLLCVAPDRPHKNLALLIRAFSTLAREGLELVLVAPGDARPGDPPPGVRIVSEIPDDELASWYGAAEALVLPSRAEGFGLPALEAMACGTPAVVAEIPALVEVGGVAAMRFDPGDVRSLVAVLGRLLDDDGERRARVAAGIERARQFTWERAAERTLEVYRSLPA